MMKKMRIQSDIVFTLLVCLLFVCGSVLGADDAAADCSNDFEKVMTCLDYAKGKASTPSQQCCSSVKGIKENNPKCLCLIIQRTHSGAQELKGLGVQEAKLLQLPSACQLQNASISDCPKLLGLSPTSPDAAIFANSSSTTPPTAVSGTSAPERADGTSSGAKHGAYLVGPMIAIAVFFFAIPTGSSSMLHSIWG